MVQTVYGHIGQRRAGKDLYYEFQHVLQQHHFQKVLGRHRAVEGNEHEGDGVEDISHHGTAYCPEPHVLATAPGLHALHDVCVGEFSQQEACERTQDYPWHVGEDVVVGLCRLVQIVGRRHPYAYVGAQDQHDVTHETQVDYALGDTVAPYLGEHVAQHVGEGEGDGSCVEVKKAEYTDYLDSHHVGNEIECHKQSSDYHQWCVKKYSVF